MIEYLVLVVVLLVVAATAIKIIRPWQKGLIERLGRYQRTVGSGLTMVFPFIERIIKVDMREQVVDVPPQGVITKDNVVVGDLSLDESLTSREVINSKLRQILDDATDKWGVRVTRVELQRIEPPRDVTEAMHRQMKAERDKRAMILEAEGQKQSAILKAEGQAEAIMRVADADRYQKKTVAEGEAQAIGTVFGAIHKGNPTNDLIAIKYLEALQKIADGKASKVFLPYEASGILASIAGVGELLKEKVSKEEQEKT
jgi:regulator of protease activity HflC (stomatin/prohibitin superfamily)